MALTSSHSLEDWYLQDIISTGFIYFWPLMFLSTLPMIRGPPIKTPSGPCCPLDKHAHDASCGGHSLPSTSYSRLPLHFTISLHPSNSPSPKPTEQSILWRLFGLCWQTNLGKDESWPLAGSVWIEWETVADGGVGMWINRLAEHLTDGICRRPRRTREFILLGEHASARFICLGRKFGCFPRSGCSINQRLQQFGKGTALLWNKPHSCVRRVHSKRHWKEKI